MAAGFERREGHLHCDGVRLDAIAARFGTPCYVYSRRALTIQFEALTAAFADLSPLICYSVKANSNLALLRLIAELGGGADIVSGGELDRALRAGIAPRHIVFSGVGKTADEIHEALAAGILSINVESPAELETVRRVAAALDARAPVAIRINPGVVAGAHTHIETGHDGTKFGVTADQAPALLAAAAADPHLEPLGFAAHIGSQILVADPYVRAAGVLRDLVERARQQGLTVDLIDVGGGLGIDYNGEQPHDPVTLAAALAPVLGSLGVRLVLEPGRFIAGNAGALLCRVIRTKHSGARRFVVVDAAMNDLLRPSLYGARHRIEPATDGRATTEPVDVVGPICETGDFLGRDVPLPRVAEGDLLVVHGAGAYASSMASNYNSRGRAPEVLVDGDVGRLIRRRETLDDLLRTELDLHSP